MTLHELTILKDLVSFREILWQRENPQSLRPSDAPINMVWVISFGERNIGSTTEGFRQVVALRLKKTFPPEKIGNFLNLHIYNKTAVLDIKQSTKTISFHELLSRAELMQFGDCSWNQIIARSYYGRGERNWKIHSWPGTQWAATNWFYLSPLSLYRHERGKGSYLSQTVANLIKPNSE